MQLGIWLPVYGGWLRTMDQPMGPDIPACLAIAQQAEAMGFDFLYASENLLNCIHGPDEGVADAWSLLGAIAAKTARIGLVGAIKPGFRSPFLVARMIDTLTQIAGRRLGINIVCGWWRKEFELSEVPWLDHGGRYDRADGFLRAFYSLFNPPTEISFEPAGDDPGMPVATSPTYGLRPEALPIMWVSGHSQQAMRITAEWGDCLFLNGMSDEALSRHIFAARQAATQWGREISIAINAYVIATETREQALARRDAVVEKRNSKTIGFFRDIMTDSGAAAWAGLDDRQMVDSNAGFDAGLIGSFEDVRARLERLAEIGVDTVVCQFDDPMRDAGPFMKRVIRPMRESVDSESALASAANRGPAQLSKPQPDFGQAPNRRNAI
jgi:dimethylsulfone monooxygenase